LPPTRSYQKLRVRRGDHGALWFTLYNPERRNAIGPRMVNELLYALEDAHADDSCRSVVITGEGKAFCAGGDFSQMTGADDGPALPPKGDYADLLLAMLRSELPIVAMVNGAAMGGGLGLVAASTFAIASVDASLGTPEVNVGLFPMMIMAVLSRTVPRRKLLEMMLLGDKLTAAQAQDFGIVGETAPADQLDAKVSALTERIASKSRKTLALGLSAYAAQADLPVHESLPLLRDRLAECLGTEDAREGLMAFLEKRTPNWKGR
jgi:enoyl-CoA hydratase/carnithine racemase